jgi:hypothetical protein
LFYESVGIKCRIPQHFPNEPIFEFLHVSSAVEFIAFLKNTFDIVIRKKLDIGAKDKPYPQYNMLNLAHGSGGK